MAMWGNKHRLHCLLCLIPSPWLHLFFPNKTIRAHLKRLRWEQRDLSPPPPPPQGQADCLRLKAASRYKTSPWMSDMCWQIITWGFIKRQASGLGGITAPHLTRTQPECQTCGWKAHQGHRAFVHTCFYSVHPSTSMHVSCISSQL